MPQKPLGFTGHRGLSGRLVGRGTERCLVGGRSEERDLSSRPWVRVAVAWRGTECRNPAGEACGWVGGARVGFGGFREVMAGASPGKPSSGVKRMGGGRSLQEAENCPSRMRPGISCAGF